LRLLLTPCVDGCPGLSSDEDKLSGLVELARKLVDGVLTDDNLPPSTKAFPIGRLREVEHTLTDFRTTGYAGVEEAMDRLAGGIIRVPQLRTEETFGRWHTVWARIQAALTGANQIADTG